MSKTDHISTAARQTDIAFVPRWVSSLATTLLLLSLLALLVEGLGFHRLWMADISTQTVIDIGCVVFAVSYVALMGAWIFNSPRNERFERFTLVLMMLPGVIMVCQPYYHFLFRWGFMVTICGIIAFSFAGHMKKD